MTVTIKYDPICGTPLTDACEKAAILAREHELPVCFEFNGMVTTVNPGDRAIDVLQDIWMRRAEAERLAKVPPAPEKFDKQRASNTARSTPLSAAPTTQPTKETK